MASAGRKPSTTSGTPWDGSIMSLPKHISGNEMMQSSASHLIVSGHKTAPTQAATGNVPSSEVTTAAQPSSSSIGEIEKLVAVLTQCLDALQSSVAAVPSASRWPSASRGDVARSDTVRRPSGDAAAGTTPQPTAGVLDKLRQAPALLASIKGDIVRLSNEAAQARSLLSDVTTAASQHQAHAVRLMATVEYQARQVQLLEGQVKEKEGQAKQDKEEVHLLREQVQGLQTRLQSSKASSAPRPSPELPHRAAALAKQLAQAQARADELQAASDQLNKRLASQEAETSYWRGRSERLDRVVTGLQAVVAAQREATAAGAQARAAAARRRAETKAYEASHGSAARPDHDPADPGQAAEESRARHRRPEGLAVMLQGSHDRDAMATEEQGEDGIESGPHDELDGLDGQDDEHEVDEDHDIGEDDRDDELGPADGTHTGSTVDDENHARQAPAGAVEDFSYEQAEVGRADSMVARPSAVGRLPPTATVPQQGGSRGSAPLPPRSDRNTTLADQPAAAGVAMPLQAVGSSPHPGLSVGGGDGNPALGWTSKPASSALNPLQTRQPLGNKVAEAVDRLDGPSKEATQAKARPSTSGKAPAVGT